MSSVGVLTVIGKWIFYTIIPLAVVHLFHRLWLHSLRQYPGPVVARITGIYASYFAATGSLHLKTHENFLKYGPVIRQSPNRLVFNTVAAIQDIYLSPKVTKGKAYHAAHNRPKYPSLILAVDRTQHRRKRKLMAPCISERSMRSFEPTMSREVDAFLKQILASSQENVIVNISERCKSLGTDIVGKLAFGHDFNTQVDSTNRYVYELMESMAWRLNAYMHYSPLRILEYVLLAFRARQLLKFDEAIRTVIKTRMSQDKDAHHDLYSMIADDMYKGELWPEAVFFLSAGGLTTATAMSATFFYLSRNPQAYATLATEIRSTFNSANEIFSGPRLAGCKYLRACIDESMRLSPPFLASSWREIDDSESEPFVVDGHAIPRGTQVAVSPYSILHNEEYFPDAYKFTPERWLEPPDTSAETEADQMRRVNMRKAFIPFMLGDRGCAGKSMAYMEASLTLARTIWFFDFEAASDKEGQLGGGKLGYHGGRGRLEEYQLGDIMVASHQGPNLLFRTRNDYWKQLVVEE